MKKLTFLVAFALVFIYGCNKQETTPTADKQQMETTDASTWILNQEGDTPVWELTTWSDQQSNSGSSDLKQNNSGHTHGDFEEGSISIAWSGTQNNGGTHGSAVYEHTFGAPFFTTVYITMDTECVMVEENEAVYGGIFTEVLNNPYGERGPFRVGNILYFKVIDNGQGVNAPPDQRNSVLVISTTSRCGVYTPSYPGWYRYPNRDVLEPGSVKVNN